MYKFKLLASKRFLIYQVIFSVFVIASLWLIFAIGHGINLSDILIGALMCLVLGGFVSYVIGWLSIKFVYSQLFNKDENLNEAFKDSTISISNTEINIDYELTDEDIKALYFYIQESFPKTRKLKNVIRRGILVAFIVEVSISIVAVLILGRKGVPYAIIGGISSAVTILYYFLIPSLPRIGFNFNFSNNYGPEQNFQLGKHIINLSSNGIVDTTNIKESITPWSLVDKMEYTERYLFIIGHKISSCIIPKRAFSNEQEFDQFAKTAKYFFQVAQSRTHG
jgi:hypothetical protein